MLKEFRAFVLRGNVVDLAVGVVIGAAFGAIVNAVVNGMLTPVLGLLGTGDLAAKSVCLRAVEGECTNAVVYGQVISAVISFVLIAAAVFFLVVKPVNHLMARLKPEPPATETTRECPECLSKVPRRARRCAFCTAEIGVASDA